MSVVSWRADRRAARGRGVAVVLLAAALLAGCAAAGEPESATDSSPSAVGSSGPPSAAEPTAAEPTADADGAADAAPADVPVTDSSLENALAEAEVAAAAAPVEIAYERLGWSMPVDPVGVAPDGQMEVPEDALRAGWYEYGPGAGVETGATVVAAHAGSYITPRGPFYELTESEVGDRVTLVRTDGTEVEYEVVEIAEIEKEVIDLRPYFDRSGAPRLVMITCGGVWNDEADSYESNVVVTAEPIG